MFIVTLLTDPARPSLEHATVEALRNAWGGGTADWLSPDIAAEFPIAVIPDNCPQVWAEMQKLGIDMVVQRAAGRRKSILLADMDSTMIEQECIDELADEAGVGARVAEITARAMNGELDFEAALRERVGLLAGLDEVVVGKVLDARITLAPGGAVLLSTMRANGGHSALVSGGFTAFSEVVAARLGFTEHRANRLLVEAGRLTGKVEEPILGRDAKVAALYEISGRLGLTPADAIAVGDGANDLGMLQAAGTGVAMHAKPAVAAAADARINHGDLTALLYLQGYSMADFALPG